MRLFERNSSRQRDAGFTLVEVMVSVAIMGIMFVSLYAGISSGFSVISLARENLRATQVLQEKMETIRLYNWDQVNSNGFIPATFSAPFFPTGSTNAGLVYQGTLTITNSPLTENYAADTRLVILRVYWDSANVKREREMQTLLSRHGLQNYIY